MINNIVGNTLNSASKFSLKGILIGFVMFVVSFPMLWWGENRQNLAEFVEKAVQIESTANQTATDGQLVRLTGRLTTPETLVDGEFLNALTTKAILIEREVEIYAWEEKSYTEKKDGKDITKYKHVKTWLKSPKDSSKFHDAKNIYNPQKRYADTLLKVQSAQVGALGLDVSKAEFFETKPLLIKETDIKIIPEQPLQIADGVIYVSKNAGANTRVVATQPEVGDHKIKYSYFPADVDVSVVGDFNGNKITPHVYGGTNEFLGVYPGNVTEFQAYLQARHIAGTWGMRIFSLFLMWIGLSAMLSPITALVGAVPVLGNVGKSTIGFITGTIALVLWLITLFLANFWLILLVIAALGIGVAMFVSKAKKQQLQQQQTA